MGANPAVERLRIEGMTCAGCQNRIERKLRTVAGVMKAQVNWRSGLARIQYDPSAISLPRITAVIESMGYAVAAKGGRPSASFGRVASTLAVIVLLYLLLQRLGLLNLLVPSQLAESGMAYWTLFAVGLATSLHCVAMCGGINLTQSLPSSDGGSGDGGSGDGGDAGGDGDAGGGDGRGGLRHGEASDSPSRPYGRVTAFAPTLLYNLGRVASYTLLGFVLGLVGWLIGAGSALSVPGLLQGALKLAAGAFMVVMGVNMLGFFPALRRLTPTLPRFLRPAEDLGGAKGALANRQALAVGVMNGLMPCGPLQSMQIVALASANPLVGAASMLLFGLGTVPLMLGLGGAVSALGRRFARKVTQGGAVLVAVLGLAMLSQGAALTGIVSPDLLLAVILAFAAIGAVSALKLSKPGMRTAATAAGAAAACLALLAWANWGALAGMAGPGPAGGGTARDGIATQMADGQSVTSTLAPGAYPNITVKAGQPVKWVIEAPQGSINGCNNRMLIQEFGIEHTFQTGANVIEFTPTKPGSILYSCWMGMIRGNITVVA